MLQKSGRPQLTGKKTLPLRQMEKNNSTSNENDLYNIAGDVKAVYPSISRSLVSKALKFALTIFFLFIQKLQLKFW